MNTLIDLFGEGKDLNALQMSCRAIVVFLLAFALIRVSGRRSFGLHTPLDNIIVIILGAVLSRAIVGASPFIPIIVSSIVIVLMHRSLGWLIANNKAAEKLMEGNRITLFKDGHFIGPNISKALVCREEIMEEVRKSALTENLAKIDTIYMERNGEISAIQKE
jgi:uncharacterized membrane protein YcaP (DUF421 family)